MQFFKQKIVRTLAFAQKRFDYFSGASRTPLKAISTEYLQETLELAMGNLALLFPPLQDTFNLCSEQLKTDAATEAGKIDGYKRLSFLQKTSTSK